MSEETKKNVFDAENSAVPPSPGMGRDKSGRPIPPPPVITNTKETRKKNLKKKIKYALIGIIAFVILFFVGVRCYFRLPVKSYYQISEKNFKIPDIGKGFIPQGLCYDDLSGDFYVTGYMKDSSASPIYIVDKKTKKLEQKVLMTSPDGFELSTHAGGISYYNGMIYVAGGGSDCLYVFNPADIRNADNGGYVSYVATVDLSTNGDNIVSSFTTSHDGILYVGEFYKKSKYETNDLHIVDTTDGKKNQALMVGFTIDSDYNATPVVAYSIPDKTQGAVFYGNSLFLSSSYSTSFSHLYYYENVSSNQASHNVLGVNVPLYILDNSNLSADYKQPPMSEEIDIVDDKLYVLTESASDKYIFGKFTGAKRVFATDLTQLSILN